MRLTPLLLLALTACFDTSAGRDRDGDGYENIELGGTDCDDENEFVHPDAPEVCNDGLDNDCNGFTDDSGVGNDEWFLDGDGDGYPDGQAYEGCMRPGDSFPDTSVGVDCDDDNPNIHPEMPERCDDGIDNNCNDIVDADAPNAATWYEDRDDDGIPGATPYSGCEAPLGSFASLGAEVDCDDTNGDVRPNTVEQCGDGVDNDCDGNIDDSGVGNTTYYVDADSDGYPGATAYQACTAPSGSFSSLSVGVDCNDVNGAIHPNAAETWYDGIDQDCAGDDDYDADADGVRSDRHGGNDCDDTEPGVRPGVAEICDNGIDDDCSGGGAPECEWPSSFSASSRAVLTLQTQGQVTLGNVLGSYALDIIVTQSDRILVFDGDLRGARNEWQAAVILPWNGPSLGTTEVVYGLGATDYGDLVAFHRPDPDNYVPSRWLRVTGPLDGSSALSSSNYWLEGPAQGNSYWAVCHGLVHASQSSLIWTSDVSYPVGPGETAPRGARRVALSHSASWNTSMDMEYFGAGVQRIRCEDPDGDGRDSLRWRHLRTTYEHPFWGTSAYEMHLFEPPIADFGQPDSLLVVGSYGALSGGMFLGDSTVMVSGMQALSYGRRGALRLMEVSGGVEYEPTAGNAYTAEASDLHEDDLWRTYGSFDVNGDGRRDVLGTHWTPSPTSMSVFLAPFVMGESRQPDHVIAANPMDGVTTGDVNGDGKEDLLIASDGYIRLLLGAGE